MRDEFASVCVLRAIAKAQGIVFLLTCGKMQTRSRASSFFLVEVMRPDGRSKGPQTGREVLQKKEDDGWVDGRQAGRKRQAGCFVCLHTATHFQIVDAM